jgi:hypothetical protein
MLHVGQNAPSASFPRRIAIAPELRRVGSASAYCALQEVLSSSRGRAPDDPSLRACASPSKSPAGATLSFRFCARLGRRRRDAGCAEAADGSERIQVENKSIQSRAVAASVVALLAVAAFTASWSLVNGAAKFSYPGENAFPSSVNAFLSYEAQQGRPVYTPFAQEPHVMALYGPLLYHLPALIAGQIDADKIGLLRVGRGISLTGTFVVFVIVLVMLRRREKTTWPLAIGFAFLFLGASILWPVSVAFRADSAEAAFAWTGIAAFVLLRDSRWCLLAILPCLVAFMFKQTAVIAPAVMVLHLWRERRTREAVVFAATVALFYGAAVLIMQATTGGEYLGNALGGLAGHRTLSNLKTVVWETVLVPNAAVFAVSGLALRRRLRANDVVAWFFLFSFLFTAATTIRDGSADNYFIKALGAACIITGGEIKRWMAAQDRWIHAVVAVLSVVLIAGLNLYRDRAAITATPDRFLNRAKVNQEHAVYMRALTRRLDSLDGPVLSQYDPLSYYLKRPLLLDSLTFSGLVDNDAFDDSQIIEDIRNTRLAAVITRRSRASQRVTRYQSTAWLRAEWREALRESDYQEFKIGGCTSTRNSGSRAAAGNL